VNELGVFAMTDHGLREEQSSAIFLSVPGIRPRPVWSL
jgi:predicted ATP-dependent serine protease